MAVEHLTGGSNQMIHTLCTSKVVEKITVNSGVEAYVDSWRRIPAPWF